MFSHWCERDAGNKSPWWFLRKGKDFFFEDIRRPFKNPFSPDIKNTPGFVIGTDAKPAFLRR